MTKFLLLFSFFLSVNLFAQKIEELSVVYNNGKISGELAHISNENVVLIIPGSGPTDRDGNNPQMQNNSLKMLSDGLVAKGISTLRIDKRGIGKSEFSDLKEESVTIDTLIDDVNTWLNQLSMRMYKNIFIVGHSEGSLIGMIAAHDRPNVRGFISIAGVGSTADKILMKQLSILPDESRSQIYKYLDTLKNGYLLSNVPKSFYMLFRPGVQPYMISWLTKNPQLEINKLKIPVLILNGDRDSQVDTSEARLLYHNANNAEIQILEGVNHVLKNVSNDLENQKSYSDPNWPIDEKVVRLISEFIFK